VLGADEAGAIHRRDRVWILCSDSSGLPVEDQEVGSSPWELRESGEPAFGPAPSVLSPDWATHQPGMAGMVDGMAGWVGRSKAVGNGQCPQQAAMAFRILHRRLTEN
jgi:hypothetical protein